MERYVCVHGHYYQPPRENPSLEAVEIQDSAYPYHDWNDRITAECYGPNGASRILDGEGRIVQIANNYARMSFNFGPTLLAWMKERAPDVYQSVLEGDRESLERFSGHGSALAQVYNHVILPLANQRDKRTQVLWGIRDFECRFGRSPEGMWLSEAAVDLETLDIMAELGIKFTILSPYQASRVRKMGDRHSRDVAGGRIDPTRPYELRLPTGRRIALFFYDGPISSAVAFEGLLNRGEHLASRLLGAFSDSRSWPQLVHIATDGETYGHHHRHGDMALAYALHYIESNNLARLTNYGEYLEKHPPAHEVEIFQNTSWSCAHGVERWRSDCGCNSGGHPGWNQAWRLPLRQALDWLRDAIAGRYDKRAKRLLKDPWQARDDYISVVLDRSIQNVEQFLRQHAVRELTEPEKIRALKLLEIQRQAMLMYTSCGWFFDEISGIETIQVLQYAGRAIQLANEVLGDSLEAHFLQLLERAKSNISEHGNGRAIYEKWIKPSLVDLRQVGAHYAMSSLFESYGDKTQIHAYTIDREDHRALSTGKVRAAVGRAKITSGITHESKRVTFSVLHLGDHNLSGGSREFSGEEAYQTLVREISRLFEQADLTGLIRAMDKDFGANTYSLRLLFRDEQRKILSTILDSTLQDAEAVDRQLYERHAPTMRFLADMGAPLPRSWIASVEVVINTGLRRAFGGEDLDVEIIRGLLDEARRWQLALDEQGLAYTLRQTLERIVERFRLNPRELLHLQKLEKAVDTVQMLPFEVDLWKVQNVYYDMLRAVPDMYPDWIPKGNGDGNEWISHFASLGEKLGFRVTEMKEKQIEKVAGILAAAEEIAAQKRIPCATYRLQFNHAFTFRDARVLVPYLHELGISDYYASPLLKARTGSAHGYDVCDHSRLNPPVGSQEDFDSLCTDLSSRNMGLMIDVVPNHMGIGDPENQWWMDVLENGPSSIYASYFDIDWRPVKPELRDKVVLPILADQYGKALESGQFKLSYEEGSFFVRYYDIKLPVAPRTYTGILEYQLPTLAQALGENNEQLRELRSILTALNYLPPRTELSAAKIDERNREKEIIKGRLQTLYQASPYVRAAIDMAVQAFNGTIGDRRSFDKLDALLDAQAYRPAFWRVAGEEINYRRFFDVNELAAIRMELPEVFQATHQFICQLMVEGKVTGLRIDHPDGLRNPRDYFRQIQESYLIHRVQAQLGPEYSPADVNSGVSDWLSRLQPGRKYRGAWPLYVVAEKILSRGEELPEDWAVDGTTGYDFLNQVNDLFVDSRSGRAFDRIYSRFVGSEINFHNLSNSARKMIMLVSLASEINALAHQLERVAEKNRIYRDFTLNSLTFAIREVIAALPAYRTYVTGPQSVGQQDQSHVQAAVAEAKRRNPRTAAEVFDFVQETLLLRNIEDFPEEEQQTLVDFVMKFQQVTGPVMAKGVEDTAFYVYNRLVSLNEVGGHPERFGGSVTEFHQHNVARHRYSPHSLLATSTHDTKRGEDVRARIDVLSEIPDEWKAALGRWSHLNALKKSTINGEAAPDRNDEYLLYQTLLGTWHEGALSPEELARYRQRVASYMNKATREAKIHTSWVNRNEQYETAVQDFVQRVLPDGEGDPFVNDLLEFQRRVAYYGRFNALSQALLKLTAPGVPDIYQGTELWDYSLVDPDNRRPVDYERRRSMLDQLRNRIGDDHQLVALAEELLETASDGRIKLYLIYRALNFRREHRQLFSDGSYLPLTVRGEKRDHVCSFARALGDDVAMVAVPRLVVRLTGGRERPPTGPEVWGNTWLTLPREYKDQTYLNVLTGELLSVGEQEGAVGLPVEAVLSHFPVALLERAQG